MNFAVCDDEKEIQATIRKYILRLYPQAQVEIFNSGEALLRSPECFDMIYLDIKMDGISGMDTARALRRSGCRAAIIFVTALPEYVYEAFDVGAFHYLLKPIEKVKFYEVLQKALEQAAAPEKTDRGDFLLIKSGRDREKIYFSDVVYAEIFNRKIIIHTTSGEAEYYGRIGELEKQAGDGFFRTHRGYLINLRYVSKYNSEEIFLDSGRVLVSKQKYPEFVKKYLSYLKESEK